MNDRPSLAAIFLEFLRLGATAFGAPAALERLRERAVVKRRWVDARGFEAGLAFCGVLPGGSTAQLCGFLGHALRGPAGAFAAFAGYCLPGCALMGALGTAFPLLVARPGAGAVLAGLWAVVPAVCLAAGLRILEGLTRAGILWALAGGAGVLFVIGLKPFSMLLGGAIIGVLVLPDPPGLPAPPASVRYSWRLPVGLLLAFAALAAGFFLLDPTLGRLVLASAKAEAWSFGSFGALPVFFADAVRTRAWLDSASFSALTALVQMAPGPVLAASAFAGWQAKGLSGALAGTAGMWAASFLVLMGALPAREVVVSCAWARKAGSGVAAVAGGMVLGLAARFALDAAWDWPRMALAGAALAALATRINPAWVVLGGALAGPLFL